MNNGSHLHQYVNIILATYAGNNWSFFQKASVNQALRFYFFFYFFVSVVVLFFSFLILFFFFVFFRGSICCECFVVGIFMCFFLHVDFLDFLCFLLFFISTARRLLLLLLQFFSCYIFSNFFLYFFSSLVVFVVSVAGFLYFFPILKSSCKQGLYFF